MGAALDNLQRDAPVWFESSGRDADGLTGRVRIGRWSEPGVRLFISDQPIPRVREAVPGACFPRRCSERHIEFTGAFCLGLEIRAPTTARLARIWWSWLHDFLQCQAVADRTRVWPLGHGLDHGAAGEYHRRALRLAERLGLEEAYFSAWLGQPSWFTSTGLTKLGDRGRRPTVPSGPARAPRVRGRRARLLRLELVILERARRKAVAAFNREVRTVGLTCCGTMRDCALASAANDTKREEVAA